MSKKVNTTSKDLSELSGFQKFVRKILMDKSPEVGTSKNDFFNNGYGGFVTVLVGCAFVATFMYYAVVNSQNNRTAQFLVPATGNNAGSMHCTTVPNSLSDVYVVDSEGHWESNTQFSLGEALYGLEMNNAQFSSQGAYEKVLQAFAGDMKTKSDHSVNNDYAWNIVFGGSYAVMAATEGDGLAAFFVEADSRMMLNVPIYSSGISSIDGSCRPETMDMTYDGTNFVFTASIDISNVNTSLLCPQLDESGALETVFGLHDRSEFNVVTTKLTFDAAAITTAIAINYQIAPLESLTPVPSLDTHLVQAYIDNSYAPMQPVYCFNASKYGLSEYGIDDLCMLKVGDMFAMPITAHYGSWTGPDFIPPACDCNNPSQECLGYDIDVGLLFIPHANVTLDDVGSDDLQDNLMTLILAVIGFQDSAQAHQMSLNDYLRPLLAVSNQATYYTPVGEDLTYWWALQSLKDTFEQYCPECFVLSFELYDYAHYVSGPTINKGGRVLRNMACSNVFYNQAVLDEMKKAPPSEITQKYLVCTDTLTTAVSTGISNAYASAQLYSGVLLGVLLFIIMKYHHYVLRGTPISSTEEREVILRNDIADLFEFILNKQHLSAEDQLVVQDKLHRIAITDPLTHVERHHHLQQIMKNFGQQQHAKVAATDAEMVYKESSVVEMISPVEGKYVV